MEEVEGLYYLCSENKGADQLCGYCKADLRLCFCICKRLVFSQRGSFKVQQKAYMQEMISLIMTKSV